MKAPKKHYKKELLKIMKLSKLKVPVTKNDRIKYKEIYREYPGVFRKNVTKFFYFEMKEHIYQGKVWRVNCSGRVRHGKSEVAQTWTMYYIDEFNDALFKGAFKSLQDQGVKYNTKYLDKLDVVFILDSQGNFLYNLREQQKEDKIIYGQCWIIDEDKESTGGTGSYSEHLEMKNVQNITAQALQSEWQLRPDRFVLDNAPYGLHQEKMDRVNKVNWSMLYELKNHVDGSKEYIFLGWVATPLHSDNELRKKYNIKKKENIINTLEGTGDLRLLERYKVAQLLASDKLFSTRSVNGKTFKLSKQQQESILNEWIINKKVQNFNSVEKFEIIEHARLLVEKQYLESIGVE